MVRGNRKESPDAIANVKDDVLEVISIGTIYTGPLDKKYWSCSRGKDRYPYPIGYNVVRIHSGNTYRMEIREKSNGPLFVVCLCNLAFRSPPQMVFRVLAIHLTLFGITTRRRVVQWLRTLVEEGFLLSKLLHITTIEEFFIPGLSQGLVLEVKRIPCSDTTIIGHNGVGEFGLWDISKRIRLARFSFPGYSIFEFLPVSLFSWRELIVSNGLEAHEHVQGVTGKQVHWPYQGRENDGDEVAVWILVSESSNFQHHHQMKGCQTTQRLGLALLAEGAFVLGSALDSRVSALDVSRDGQLYMWSLSSGEMVFNANSCGGGSISCIAADEKSGSVLVASNNNVLLYAPTNEI